MIYARGTVKRVYKEIQGGVLAQALTGTWTNGSSVQVEAATHFSPDGGDGFFEDEAFSYASREITESDNPTTPDLLLGVIRDSPVSHAKGTFVQEGDTETVTKLVDIEVDGELLTGIPVDPSIYTYLKLGTYTEDEMPVVTVEFGEEGTALVTGAALGTVPLVGADIETMPTPGGGAGAGGAAFPPGQDGWEDGEAPSEAPTVTAVGAISSIHVIVNTLANSTTVNYKVHVHTTTGFTPADNTLVGIISLAGLSDYPGLLVVKSFPSGHILSGSPVAGTTYYVKVIPSDGDGDGPVSTQVSAVPVSVVAEIPDLGITSTKIADDSISTPKLQANSVVGSKIQANSIESVHIVANTIVAGDIAAGTITGDRIAATTITADKLSVSTLSAITANLGTVTAGSISGVTITGGTFRTAASGKRVQMASTVVDTIQWFNSSNVLVGYVGNSGGTDFFIDASAKIILGGSGTGILVQDSIEIDGTLNHDGSAVGFFGVTPASRIAMTNLGGADSTTAQLHSKLNTLLDNLRTYGLLS